MSDAIQKQILSDISQCKYFSILAGATTDVSQTEQLSLSVRFIKDRLPKCTKNFCALFQFLQQQAKILHLRFSPNYLNLGLIWNICVPKVMMARVIWAENNVVSRLEWKNCTVWPCTLIAATMFLTWSLVLHRSCQLFEMRWQLYRTYAFFCRVLHSAHRYFKTMLKKKFQARLLRDRSWNQFAPHAG